MSTAPDHPPSVSPAARRRPVPPTIPQRYVDARISAPAVLLVNSPGNLGGFVGNLGGFVSPTAFGIRQDATGPTRGGLIGLSAVGVLAAVGVALGRGGGHQERARGRRPGAKDHGPGRGPVRGGPARVR
ncbi:hypothetical protein ACWGGS_01035 [Streptomyces decoyicus]